MAIRGGWLATPSTPLDQSLRHFSFLILFQFNSVHTAKRCDHSYADTLCVIALKPGKCNISYKPRIFIAMVAEKGHPPAAPPKAAASSGTAAANGGCLERQIAAQGGNLKLLSRDFE